MAVKTEKIKKNIDLLEYQLTMLLNNPCTWDKDESAIRLAIQQLRGARTACEKIMVREAMPDEYEGCC